MVMRTILTLVLALFAVECGTDKPTTVFSELGLVCPCVIEKWVSYLDGGSMGGTIRDSKGTVLAASWDGRMRGEDEARVPRLAFIGAEHPGHEGAVPVQLGSETETQLIAVLDAWVATQIPSDKLDLWVSIFFDYTAAGKKRRSQLPKLSDSQKRALLAARTSEYLKRQRALGHAPGYEDL
jgi:hypothetical protein